MGVSPLLRQHVRPQRSRHYSFRCHNAMGIVLSRRRDRSSGCPGYGYCCLPNSIKIPLAFRRSGGCDYRYLCFYLAGPPTHGIRRQPRDHCLSIFPIYWSHGLLPEGFSLTQTPGSTGLLLSVVIYLARTPVSDSVFSFRAGRLPLILALRNLESFPTRARTIQ